MTDLHHNGPDQRKADAWIVPGGLYIISGGGGTLAKALVRHLLDKADVRVALLGRRPVAAPTSGACHVTVDVADKPALADALDALRRDHGPVRGVFHLAGTTRDGALTAKTFADFDAVLRPKTLGLQNLDRLTQDDPLTVFVGFSSVAAVTGNAGQADYAIANAFVDSYLAIRQRRVLAGQAQGRSVSINWPYWADGGMHPHDGRDPTADHASGIQPLTLAAGFAALDRAIASDSAGVVVFAGDRDKLASWLAVDAGAVRPDTAQPVADAPRADAPGPGTALPALIAVLLAEVADLLHFRADDISDLMPLSELGFDSITFAGLADRLNQRFGLTLTPPELFDAETVEDMAARLLQAHPAMADQPAEPPSDLRQTDASAADAPAIPHTDHAAPSTDTTDDPVVIVGLEVRLPGAATAAAFWDLLDGNRCAITGVPAQRWTTPAGTPDQGGFITGVDLFDPFFFGISPKEADWMDPQQRILLECVWHAIEDAGLRRATLAGSQTGVFVGASSNDYGVLIADVSGAVSPHRSTGLSHAILPNRISHVLDLHGPSESVDTACSSSLVALNRALRALRADECQIGIVAGVNAMLSPDLFFAFNASGMLSPSGRCHTFDAAADGYVRGEGVGAVVMMRLSQARKLGLRVRAVVRGAAVNHVGHTSSLTVPSSTSQAALIRAALADADLTPADIDAVEAHGTGTRLGDPIEVAALAQVFGASRAGLAPVAVSSVKPNIGHLEAAAGIAGIAAAVLALEARRVPGNPALHDRNPFIGTDGSGLELVRGSIDWPTPADGIGRVARIGVSSFGFGGTSAHVILEAASAQPGTRADPSAAEPVALLVSAHSGTALMHVLADVRAMAAGLSDADLPALAAALVRQRDPHPYRVAVVADGMAQVVAALDAHLARGVDAVAPCEATDYNTRQQQARAYDAILLQPAAARADALAALFHKATTLDWTRAFDHVPQRWMALPKTRFDHARHWFDGARDGAVNLQRDDALILDHRVMDRAILPGTAALAVLVDAAGAGQDTAFAFADLQWRRPVDADAVANGLRVGHVDGQTVLMDVDGQTLVTARALLVETPPGASVPPPQADTAKVADADLYLTLARRGITYGPTYQRLAKVHAVAEPGVVTAVLTAAPPTLTRRAVIASTLDAALQAAVGLVAADAPLAAPVSARRIAVYGDLASARHVRVRAQPDESLDFDVCAPDGTLLAQLSGLRFAALTGAKASTARIYVPGWQPHSLAAPDTVKRRVVIASDDRALIAAMTGQADPVACPIGDAAAWARLLADGKGAVVVLDLRGQAAPDATIWPDLVRLAISASGLIVVLDRALQAVSGVLRTVAAEHPGVWFKTLQVLGTDCVALAHHIQQEASRPEIAELRYTATGSRMTRALHAVSDPGSPISLAGRVVVITGGFGGLGQALAQDLRIRMGARVALIGHNAPPQDLRARGAADADLVLSRADGADPAQLAAALDEITARLGPVDHVLHLAGLLRDGPALATTAADYQAACLPKVTGLRALLDAPALDGARSITAFSSVAALFGNAGQAAYAAANGACVDLVAARDDPRLRVVDWPLWRDGGMWSQALATRYAGIGLDPLTTAAGIDMLYRVMAGAAAHVAVLQTATTAPDMISLHAPVMPAMATGSAAATVVPPPTDLGPTDVAPADVAAADMDPSKVRASIAAEITAVLGLAAGRLRGGESLERYGLDSALTLDLTARLETRFGPLPKTLFFEYPTLDALAAYLGRLPRAGQTGTPHNSAAPQTDAPQVAADARVVTPAGGQYDGAIAVVGLSGRFPGAASVEAFWDNLARGVDSIGPVPVDRWADFSDLTGARGEDGAIYVQQGGFITGHDRFDNSFFRIPMRDAKRIDPQERLFLTECWRTLETAGYPPERLAAQVNADVGVYAGVMWSEYQLYGRFDGARADRLSLGSSFASIANRASFFLGLKGPSLAIDSMCSSSLTVLHLACAALRHGECRMALAGGVNLSLHPNKFLQLSQSNFASDDGRCRSFGQGGTGYGPGEGVGVALLRPLADALAAGDRVLAVILGSALNHGGAATGYTVPDPAQQADVIARAWATAGRDPATADYIEAHGTGTPLGDPIEIRGLARVFAGDRSLPIGSVKSNVGHLEAAAGMAALAKVVGQMQSGTLYPTLHADTLNPDLGIADTGLRVQTTPAPWPRRERDGQDQPYLTGISSFGAGGANAHIVVEGPPLAAHMPARAPDTAPQVILISARSQAALEQRVSDLRDWLASHPALRLDDVAFTLAVGRSHFDRRFAILVADMAALRAALDDILTGRPGPHVLSTEFLTDHGVPHGDDALVAVAQTYVGHADSNPAEADLWAGRVVALPCYPFEERRIWVDPRKTPVTLTPRDPALQPDTPPDPPHATEERHTMLNTQQPRTAAGDAQGEPLADRLDLVRTIVAAQLEEQIAAIDPDRPFSDFGIDSIHAVQIARRIGDSLGRDVPVAELYTHATPRRLATWLAEQPVAPRPDGPVRPDRTAAAARTGDAVVVRDAVPLAGPDQHAAADMQAHILAVVAKVLDEDPATLDPQRPFRELGMDSVHNVQIARVLTDGGIAVTANDLFEFPTVARLAAHLAGKGAGAGPVPQPAAQVPQVSPVDPPRNTGSALTALHLRNPLPQLSPMGDGPVRLKTMTAQTATTPGSSRPTPTPVDLRAGQVRRHSALIGGVGSLESIAFAADVLDAPGADLVEIAVAATTISLSDLMRMRGTYPEMPAYPFAAGVEVAGTVTRVGPNVTDIAVGAPVVAMMSKTFGGHATIVHAHRAAVVQVPDGMSAEDAVTLPSSFLTAYYGLIELGSLARGETVLIHSGASALGQIAIQLVHDAGGTVIATTSRADKADFLRGQGIACVINHATEDFAQAVMRETGGRGVDIVLNMLGPDTIQSGIDCLAIGGRYLEAALGALKAAPRLDLSGLAENRSVRAIGLRAMLWQRGPDAVRHYLGVMTQMIAQGRIAPLPATQFGMADLRAAIAHIQSRQSIGRTVLVNDLPDLNGHAVPPADHPRPAVKSAPDAAQPSATGTVAVIGMAARFGDAASLRAVERALLDGRDLVGPVPAARRALGFAMQEIGSFVPQIDKFDPQFFDISPAEAEWMDPQQRILLEDVWCAIEDAGICLTQLRGSRTGVFVGARASSYADTRAAAETEQGRLHAFTGGLGSILAGRVSYAFDLRGPAITVDTACSSGLVALDMAATSILRGDCDMAIVAGISIGTAPGLSPGKATACRAFSDDANGFVIGEGAGVLVLRGSAAAQAAGDRVHGLVLATAVNQDGLSNGLLAPNGGAQKDLLQAAWARAGITGDQIDVIEAHGTGTVLGDPVEFGALQDVMARTTGRRQFCALGSAKSNFGHTLAAAGIAGVIKVLLGLRNAVIAPSLHFTAPNARIDIDASAFYVPTRAMPWPASPTRRRIGAVSAFGFSGTNAHVVLAEGPPRAAVVRADHGVLPFPLSARSDDALQARIADLTSWLTAQPDVPLEVLSHTLCHRRTAFERRHCVLADSRTALIAALEGAALQAAKPALQAAVADFLAGRDVDWTGCVPVLPGALADLPNYPFARRTCFRAPRVAGPIPSPVTDAGTDHALAQSVRPVMRAPDPVAVPSSQVAPDASGIDFGDTIVDAKGRYIPVQFQETAFYLDDHRVQGRAVLPGVVTLDLAARLAADLPAMAQGYTIRDVIFSSPFAVDGTAEGRLRYVQQQNGCVSVRFYKCDGATEHLCSQARLVPDAATVSVAPPLSPTALDQICPDTHGAAACYRLICAASIHHGPSLQSLQVVRSGPRDCFASLEIPEAVRGVAGFQLHPSLMDGALQALVGFAFGHAVRDTYLPFSIDEVRRYRPLPDRAIAHLRALPADSDDRRVYDISIADPDGAVVLTIRGFLHRKVPGQAIVTTTTTLPDGIASVLYVPGWQDCVLPKAAAAQHVVVMESKNAALDDTLVQVLQAQGHRVTRAGMRPRNGIAPPNTALSELFAETDRIDTVICPWELVDLDQGPDQGPNLAAWLDLLQTILHRPGHSRLRCVTLLPGTGPAVAFSRGLSALLRTAAQESPDLTVRTIHGVDQTAQRLTAACALGLGDMPGAALDLSLGDTPDRALLRVLMPLDAQPEAPATLQGPRKGCVVITGGAGGIGRQLADHAACIWNADVAILGRTPQDDAIAHQLSGLRQHGVRASYHVTDVTDAEALAATLTDVRRAFGAIGGVLHCAGILGDRRLVDLDVGEFRRVAAPKAQATATLDRLTRQDALAFFVTMSSLGGVVGNAGQGPYTYGSAVMDALMDDRHRAAGEGHAQGRSLSLNWPLWADGGMHVDPESEKYIRQTLGMVPMPGAVGLRMLDRALALPDPQLGVLVGERAKLDAFFAREADPLAAQTGGEAVAQPVANPVPVDRGVTPGVETVLPFVIELVAKVSGWDPHDLNPIADLSTYGFDSVMLTALTNAINETHHINVPPAEIFSHPTIVDLAKCLTLKYGSAFAAAPLTPQTPLVAADPVPPAAVQAVTLAAPARKTARPDHPAAIAVIGMAGRYPDAPTLEAFWDNLAAGRDSVKPVPKDRWSGPRFEGGQPLCAFGGFLDDITAFEPGFFGISPAEAAMMDPQDRLFLEVAQHSFDNAGYGRTRLAQALGGNVGVFVGVMWNEFQLFSNPMVGEIGSSGATLANRVSYFYGLNGPSLSLDTMCSSSLTALHLAGQSLVAGDCRAALVGGVNLSLHPNKYARLARNRFSAPDGKCRAFGADGQGYVPGEGIGAVLLRPLADALADGDHIHAVIRGSAINHGGRTSGFTVPNGAAQAAVIARALRTAQVDPATITCIETHGTGTPLGDPIEIHGLSTAFGPQAAGQCAIGSVKTNVGHLESTAGMAGLHKIILQLKHRKIAPSLHADTLNPDIDFARTPFRVNRTLSDWTAQGPLRAGLSSFGAGGGNAHVIVEEAPVQPSVIPIDTLPRLVVLSARTEASLQATAAALADHLARHADTLTLSDIAHTLTVGREQMRLRAAIICDNVDVLTAALHRMGNGNDTGWTRGAQDAGFALRKVALDAATRPALTAAMTQWLTGATLDTAGRDGQIIPLPGYGFDRATYWIDDSGYGRGSDAAAGPEAQKIVTAQPVLHSATASDQANVTQSVQGTDPLARDHVIAGRMILPGSSLLEFARSGAAALTGKPVRVLEDVAWLAPAALDGITPLTLTADIDSRGASPVIRVHDAAMGKRLCQIRLPVGQDVSDLEAEPLDALRRRIVKAVDMSPLYHGLAERGYAYGPLYRSLHALWTGESEGLARVTLPEGLAGDADRFVLHPALVDGAFQSVLGVVADMGDRAHQTPYLPFQVQRVDIGPGTGAGPLWVHAVLAEASAATLRFDLTLYDDAGRVGARLRGFTLRALPVASVEQPPHMAPASDGKAAALVTRFFVETLKFNAADITPDLLLEDCGIDSIALVELTRELEDELGCALPPSELVGLRSFADLVTAIERDLNVAGAATAQDNPVADLPHARPAAAAPTPPAPLAAPATARVQPDAPAPQGHKKVALIGMACRVPGSMHEDAFWDHLVHERNLITEVPPDRWDWRENFDPRKGVPGKTYSKWNGFAPGLGAYDLKRFRLTLDQASQLDPQQLLMMELARDAMENAGYDPREFAGKDTAVVIGAAARSVDTEGDALKQRNVVSNRIQNMVAARVSDFYDLHGTSYTMDTACSSTLVALHDACRIILCGEAETAMAGGIVMFTSSRANVGFAQAQVLSDEDKCFVFDRRAKGIVLSEGAGLFLLKDYDRALADGDNIRAVILGSAVNNDGRTMGITTPNGVMQRDVIAKALARAQIDARSVGYLEAHGTGTLLGDPIEIKAATEAYRAHTSDLGFCGVASVKSSIGHMLLASAAGSVVKVVKSLETGIMPATLHCEEPHPRFEFANSPFYPVQKTMPWPDTAGPRRAAVSSFGFGGTNAHMIFEAFDPARAGHVCTRQPLPRTAYDRVTVWPQLGVHTDDAPVTPTATPLPVKPTPRSLEDLLGQLASGALSVEQALALQRGTLIGAHSQGESQ